MGSLAALSPSSGYAAAVWALELAVGLASVACAVLLAVERLRLTSVSTRRLSPAIVWGLTAFAVLTAATAFVHALGLGDSAGLRLVLDLGRAVAAGSVALGLAARARRAAARAEDPEALADAEALQEALGRAHRDARWLQLFASRTEEGMIVTDARRRIEWVNEGFTRITGYEPAEVVGRTPGSLLQGPESDPAVRAYVGQRLRAEKPVRAEILNYAKSGRKYWATMEIQPIFDADGRLVNYLSVQTDVTERKRDERRLEAQYAVMRILGDCMRLDEAIPHLLATIGRTLDFDVAAFWIWDRQARTPRLAGRPWASGRVDAGWAGDASALIPNAALAGPMDRVWTTGAPAWVSEIAAPPPTRPGPRRRRPGTTSGEPSSSRWPTPRRARWSGC